MRLVVRRPPGYLSITGYLEWFRDRPDTGLGMAKLRHLAYVYPILAILFATFPVLCPQYGEHAGSHDHHDKAGCSHQDQSAAGATDGVSDRAPPHHDSHRPVQTVAMARPAAHHDDGPAGHGHGEVARAQRHEPATHADCPPSAESESNGDCDTGDEICCNPYETPTAAAKRIRKLVVPIGPVIHTLTPTTDIVVYAHPASTERHRASETPQSSHLGGPSVPRGPPSALLAASAA